MREIPKDVYISVWVDGEDLAEFGEGGAIMWIYCVKKTVFNLESLKKGGGCDVLEIILMFCFPSLCSGWNVIIWCEVSF